MEKMKRIVGRDVKCLSNLLRRIHFASPVVKELEDLTGMHGYVLGYLKRETEARDVFQKDIERVFEMRRSTASEILKLMERNGLITREAMETDGRLKKILLTDKAREYGDKLDEEFSRIENKIVEGVTEEELEQFYAVYDKIKGNMIDLMNE